MSADAVEPLPTLLASLQSCSWPSQASSSGRPAKGFMGCGASCLEDEAEEEAYSRAAQTPASLSVRAVEPEAEAGEMMRAQDTDATDLGDVMTSRRSDRSDVSRGIANQLNEAQREARRLRWRISGPPLVLGLLAFFAAVAIMVVNLSIGSPVLFCVSTVGSVVGGGLQLLSLLATDHRAVSLGMTAWCIGSASVCVAWIWIILRLMSAANLRSEGYAFHYCYVAVSGFLVLHQATFVERLFRALLRLGTRAKLMLMWRLFAEFSFVLGMWQITIGTLDLLARCDGWAHYQSHLGAVVVEAGIAPESASLSCWGRLLVPTGLLLVFLGAFWALRRRQPQMPRRLHAWLAARGEDVAAAASIASALGGRDIGSVMEKAKKRCRAVRLDRVTKQQMTSNEPMDFETYSRSGRPTPLGSIDVFVSHSWHDDADAKWEALQSWRKNFKMIHNREPVCWIDKYCIDQTNISEDLMCLPVYLAGCRSLLILHGPTYLTRLWCIMELMVYMLMGNSCKTPGSISLASTMLSSDSIKVQSTMRSEEADRERIDSFSVRNATCVKPEDKDMLFSIVEAGFQDFDQFDDMVVRMMTKLTCSSV